MLILAVIIGIYLFLGCIMDSLSMLLLTIPIFFPIIISMAKDVPMKETFEGIVPFLMSDILRILLIVFVPSITLVALRF